VKVKHFTKLFANASFVVTLIAASCFPVNAQSNLVKIGTDSDGAYFFLDTNTLRPYQRFQIKQLKNNIMYVFTMSGNCRDNKIWLTKIEAYNSDGVKVVVKSEIMEESRFEAGSTSANALEYYCKTF
jgi:hypothetical protein